MKESLFCSLLDNKCIAAMDQFCVYYSRSTDWYNSDHCKSSQVLLIFIVIHATQSQSVYLRNTNSLQGRWKIIFFSRVIQWLHMKTKS